METNAALRRCRLIFAMSIGASLLAALFNKFLSSSADWTTSNEFKATNHSITERATIATIATIATNTGTTATNSTNLTTSKTDISKDVRNVIYSWARTDRSGSVIHDMLMCHAYAFHSNQIYGGACVPPAKRQSLQKNIRNVQEILSVVGLEKHLSFACPAGKPLNRSITPSQLYRNRDTGIFTSEYLSYLQGLIKYDHPTTVTTSQDSFRIRKIVVHVRRGDVGPCRPDAAGYPRYLPNSHYLALIDRYTQLLLEEDQMQQQQQQQQQQTNVEQKPIKVQTTMFSESRSHESFDDFTQRGYNMILDGDVAQVWEAFVTSLPDVIILSRSSFSFAPAVLSKARHVVYTPFWHRPLPHWEIVNDDLLNRTIEAFNQIKARC